MTAQDEVGSDKSARDQPRDRAEEATPVTLTIKERADLEVLARSQKAQHRKRQRARIVLMAGDGAPTREIARTIRCTIGTASKWRVRFAAEQMAGLDDAGERGAEPKYGAEHNASILALLDQNPFNVIVSILA